jgi:UDP-glucose 4-epimerase
LSVNLVTGGAGFIGANLVPRLLERGHRVIVADNLSRGRRIFLEAFEAHPCFQFVEVDCAEAENLLQTILPLHRNKAVECVWHMAANSDIPAGVADPRVDLKDTFHSTFGVLETMRALGIPCLRFASSSAVYGDLKDTAISESSGPLNPISNYGAMKLASEALISAAVESFLKRADIFRFPNVVGTPATHGVLLDLIRKAMASPGGFDILGDGTQKKIYLHVQDLISAMLFIGAQDIGRHNIINIGPSDEGITVREIAQKIRSKVAPNAVLRFGMESRGWVGDVPRFRYDTTRLAALGWTPQLGSAAAIDKAIADIMLQKNASREAPP